VLTTDAVQIAAGARAQIRRWGGDRDLSAHVRRVDPSAFTKISALGVEEQRVDVVLDLDAPRATWAALGDGFRVEADIEIYERDGALVIPASAMFRREDVWSVFVVEDGRAFQRAVSIARSNGAEAEIREGLGAGDVVILHPGDRLEDETRVSVIEVVTREALAVTGR
jgi:HlyD family secretion protein